MNEAETHIEHERRFVLNRMPDAVPDTTTDITQVYMPDGSRLRKSVPRTPAGPGTPGYARIVKQFIGGTSSTETTFGEASEEVFDRAIAEGLPRASKVRRTYPYEGLVWEVDEFCAPFTLVIAELELDDPLTELRMHPAIGPLVVAEVTGVRTASNSALARSWSPDVRARSGTIE